MSTWIDELTIVFLLPIRTNSKHLIFPCLFSSVYSSSHDFPWPSHNIHFLIVYHLWFIFSLLQVKLTWWRGCITSLELHVGLANICGVPRGAWNCGQWQGTDYKLKSVPIPGGLTECARQSQIHHFSPLWLELSWRHGSYNLQQLD